MPGRPDDKIVVDNHNICGSVLNMRMTMTIPEAQTFIQQQINGNGESNMGVGYCESVEIETPDDLGLAQRMEVIKNAVIYLGRACENKVYAIRFTRENSLPKMSLADAKAYVEGVLAGQLPF
jgi:ribosomal protein L7/L12